MVNWNCAPGGTAPDKFELILVSAGPSVVVVACAVLLVVATACSFFDAISTLLTTGTFTPRFTSDVVVRIIVLNAPPCTGAGTTQISLLPLTVVGSGTALPAPGVKPRPVGSVSVT